MPNLTQTAPPGRHINLLRGWPGPPLLPSAQISAAMANILSNPAHLVHALEYGPDGGFGPLRSSLATWLAGHYQTHPPDPDRICITGGASQSIACILQCFSDPVITKAVWLVAPVYFLVCPIFEDAGFAGRLRAVPEDAEGVDATWLDKELQRMNDKDLGDGEAKFKPNDPLRKAYRHIIYCVPSCSNPSGKTMTLCRRQELVKVARKHDALVICDDVYDMLQWHVTSSTSALNGVSSSPFPSSCRLPRLVDIDLSLGRPHPDPVPAALPLLVQERGGKPWFGNAISNGSFSKLLCPGLRTGWIEGTVAFALGLSRTGSTRSGGAPSQLCAAAIYDMMSSGTLDALVSTLVRPALQRKHSALLEALALAKSKGVGWELVEGTPSTYGGYFVWIRLPSGVSSAAVAEMAETCQNLTVAPGNAFQVTGDEAAACFDGYVRLCFAWEDEEAICSGVERLAQVVFAQARRARPLESSQGEE